MATKISLRRAGLLAVVLLLLGIAFLLGCETGDEASEPVAGAPRAKAGPGGFAVLKTRRCPTESTVGQPYDPPPKEMVAPIPAAAAGGLSIYVSTFGARLVGPEDWECAAAMGVDGGQLIGVVPPGSARQAWVSGRGDAAVTARIESACAGCIASMICAFFPKASVVEIYGDCPGASERERVDWASPSTAIFTDPPGVEGTGVGSGGALPSVGVVSYNRWSGARRVSCTVPTELAPYCGAMISATLAFAG